MERVVGPGGLAAPDHRLREQMRRLQLSPQPRETLTTYTCTCSYMLMYVYLQYTCFTDHERLEGRQAMSGVARSYKLCRSSIAEPSVPEKSRKLFPMSRKKVVGTSCDHIIHCHTSSCIIVVAYTSVPTTTFHSLCWYTSCINSLHNAICTAVHEVGLTPQGQYLPTLSMSRPCKSRTL